MRGSGALHTRKNSSHTNFYLSKGTFFSAKIEVVWLGKLNLLTFLFFNFLLDVQGRKNETNSGEQHHTYKVTGFVFYK